MFLSSFKNGNKKNIIICGNKVMINTKGKYCFRFLYGRIIIVEIAKNTEADSIIIALPSASAKVLKEITQQCLQTGCDVKTLPGLYQLIDGNVSVSRLRDVDVQDLLGREPVKVNLDEVMGYIEEQVVLVTGGGGSIGSELCRQIATHNPKQLIILDIPYFGNEVSFKKFMP